MPTHQGKSQTDIVIGDGGESFSLSLEVLVDAADAVDVRWEEQSGALSHDGAGSWTVLDAAGALLGTFAVTFQVSASPDPGIKTQRTRIDSWDALAKGAVSWPTSGSTLSRDWSVTRTGLGFVQACLDVTSAPEKGFAATTTVLEQTAERLVLELGLDAQRTRVASLTVTFDATTTSATALPVVDDQLGA